MKATVQAKAEAQSCYMLVHNEHPDQVIQVATQGLFKVLGLCVSDACSTLVHQADSITMTIVQANVTAHLCILIPNQDFNNIAQVSRHTSSTSVAVYC